MYSNGFELLDDAIRAEEDYVEATASHVEEDVEPTSEPEPEEEICIPTDPAQRQAQPAPQHRTFAPRKPRHRWIGKYSDLPNLPTPLLFAVVSVFISDTLFRVLKSLGFQHLHWIPAIALIILAFFIDQVRLKKRDGCFKPSKKRDGCFKPSWKYTAFTYACVAMVIPAYLSPVVGAIAGVSLQVCTYAAIFKEPTNFLGLGRKELEEAFEPASWLIGAFVTWPFI